MNTHNNTTPGSLPISLPGAADAIREAHGDWIVSCAVAAVNGQKRKLCVITQEQFHNQTRQRALAIELRPENGGTKGTLVLPFGLALQEGAKIRIDEAEPSKPHPFRTALPAGSIIDLDFGASTLATMKIGNQLNIGAVAADTGQTISFAVSLNGFAGAFARMEELLR